MVWNLYLYGGERERERAISRYKTTRDTAYLSPEGRKERFVSLCNGGRGRSSLLSNGIFPSLQTRVEIPPEALKLRCKAESILIPGNRQSILFHHFRARNHEKNQIIVESTRLCIDSRWILNPYFGESTHPY